MLKKRTLVTAAALTSIAFAFGPGHAEVVAEGKSIGEIAAPSDGYTLFAPLRSNTTFLIDMEGEVAHRWESERPPGQSVYLLDDGCLLRTGRAENNHGFDSGGAGGRVQKIAPDGEVVWDFVYADDTHLQHHDVEPLPNGNVLLLAWERKSAGEAIAAGRDPALLRSKNQEGVAGTAEMWPDHIVEIEPVLPDGGKIVWEWHVWDHLIQDFDREQANFGVVADHPELIDINVGRRREVPSDAEEAETLRRLRALGYLGDQPEEEEAEAGERRDGPGRGGRGADWNHGNSIDYHPELDQILLSVRELSEIWIIDHGTTTEEAAGHTGGRRGKGGDLLYRWGNPANWHGGTEADRQLFVQHDAQWIEAGLPGAGHVLLFNNGEPRARRAWSSIDELVLPLDDEGGYVRATGAPFGPGEVCWSYHAAKRNDFFESHISGTQRLPSGNTLICAGGKGRIFEVTPEGETIWEHENRFGGDRPRPPGRRGDGNRPPRFGDRRDRRGPPPDGPDAPGDREGPPRGGRRGGPPGDVGRIDEKGNSLFRAWRYSSDHPGLKALWAAKKEEARVDGEEG
jgi:hypothetical protein